MRKIQVARPGFSEKDIRAISDDIARVLESGWLTSGPLVEKLETRFRNTVGTRYAVAVNSGTAALHVLTAYLHLRAKDEVVVPANTFAATANAVLFAGGKPVLADCDLESLNVTTDTIERKLSKRTKGVIVTHVGGNPCEMDEIRRLCKEKGLPLFEDSAHAAGASYRGRMCGSLSLGSAFSLYPTKIFTSAEGGFVCTSNGRLRNFAKLFRNAGRKRFGSGPILILGHNYRMSDVHAAIGMNQLAHINEFLAKRRGLARAYDEELARLEWATPQFVAAHSASSYYAYIVMLGERAPVSRQKLSGYLRSKGVETTVMFNPVHTQPYFRKLVAAASSVPNAEMVGRRSLVLPLHPAMNESDIAHVIRAMTDAASGA